MATAVCLKKERQCKKERLRSSDQSPGMALLIDDTLEIGSSSALGDRRHITPLVS